jgi:nicotinate-nucleotide adenylyltransferase
MNRRVGLFGGTFDPPHIGHMVVAQDVFERLALDLLVVMPAARPPHREAVLGPETRLEFVRTMCAGDERLEVSDIEVRRAGPSYTVDTLRELHAALDPAELFLVIGSDQLRAFHTWRDPDEILRLATLAVMKRAGDDGADPGGIPFVPVEVTRVDTSSTLVRERLEQGRSIRYLVPESIREDIERQMKVSREQT